MLQQDSHDRDLPKKKQNKVVGGFSTSFIGVRIADYDFPRESKSNFC